MGSAKLILLAVLASPAAERALPPPNDPEAVFFKADRFEYQGSTTGANAQILLNGRVEVKDSTWTLRAEEAFLDMEERICHAQGGFELDDGLSVLRGKSGRFDLGRGVGSVDDVRAEYQPWRVWAVQGTASEDRASRFRSAVFTSCDGNPPDYHFRASRLKIRPKKYMLATNVRFFVGRVPVFWTPVLWKPLDPKRLVRTRFSPSYDNRNGGGMRSTTDVDLGGSLMGRVFLDYYTQPGWAGGSELLYKESDDSRGALYGYGTRENGTHDARWTTLGDLYHRVSSSYSLQGRLQAQSDPEVNNHYVRSNAFRVNSELINSAAFTRQTKRTTTRLSYARRDLGLIEDKRFRRQTESLPRLDWQTAEVRHKKVPVLFTFNGFADNSYDRSRDFQQKSAGLGFEGLNSFVPLRGMSVTPRFGYRQIFEDKRMVGTTTAVSSATLRDTFTGFYSGGLDWRMNSPVGAWDAGYRFERRLKPNEFQGDAGAPDFGVERNITTLQHTLRPARSILLRSGSGYDFRRFRNSLYGFRSRVQPITTDISWTVTSKVALSLRNDYQLDRGNRSFLVQADWGDRDGTFVGVGASQARDRADTWFSSLEGGWAPSTNSFRVNGALRSLVKTPGGFDLRGAQLFEKELSVTKRLHDFDTRLLVRFRPGGVKEVLFRIDLRTAREILRREKRKDWESEWFPWRGGKESDRE